MPLILLVLSALAVTAVTERESPPAPAPTRPAYASRRRIGHLGDPRSPRLPARSGTRSLRDPAAAAVLRRVGQLSHPDQGEHPADRAARRRVGAVQHRVRRAGRLVAGTRAAAGRRDGTRGRRRADRCGGRGVDRAAAGVAPADDDGADRGEPVQRRHRAHRVARRGGGPPPAPASRCGPGWAGSCSSRPAAWRWVRYSAGWCIRSGCGCTTRGWKVRWVW